MVMVWEMHRWVPGEVMGYCPKDRTYTVYTPHDGGTGFFPRHHIRGIQ